MTLISVTQAKSSILSGAERIGLERVSIYVAKDRVLAENLAATVTQPPFAASAMDGYAVRAGSIASTPVRLRVVGQSAAGHGFDGTIELGEAVRIFTGAPLPAGADTVVIQENTKALDNAVEILESAKTGQFVRPRGYDFCAGDDLLREGLKLGSRDIMLAAAMNYASVLVARKPVVALLANGDELVPPGRTPGPDQIISAIPAGMKAAIEAWGGEAQVLDLAKDTRESLAEQIAAADGADVLVTIGGASVGDHDLVRAVLRDAGARFDVFKIAMRPGKPVMFGFKGRQRFLSLPGNPVSAVLCARVFLKPLLDRLLGARVIDEAREMPLREPIPANGERDHYMRGTMIGGEVAALRDQDSSLIKVFAEADCLIVRPSRAPALPQGATVPVIPLDF